MYLLSFYIKLTKPSLPTKISIWILTSQQRMIPSFAWGIPICQKKRKAGEMPRLKKATPI